mmetsp:Transcript_34063/g.78558  ORF Transcript_34063/g.78558 Transcript_34063/m.78558 type:complete len:268 (+) Transcript_34063:599-1402(+)
MSKSGSSPLPIPSTLANARKMKVNVLGKRNTLFSVKVWRSVPTVDLIPAAFFSELLIFERSHEIARQFLNSQPVGSPGKNTGFFNSIHQGFRVLGQIQITDCRSTGKQRLAECSKTRAHIRFQLVHHSKVVVNKVPVFINTQISRVWVTMEVGCLHDLAKKGVGSPSSQEFPIQPKLIDLLQICQLEGVDKFHCKHARGGDFTIDPRNSNPLDILEVLCKALRVRSLVQIINLKIQKSRTLVVDLDPITVCSVCLGVELIQQLSQLL